MVLSVLYVWCQLHKDVIVSFWFGTRFKAMYLPWVLLAFNVIISGGWVYSLICNYPHKYLIKILQASAVLIWFEYFFFCQEKIVIVLNFYIEHKNWLFYRHCRLYDLNWKILCHFQWCLRVNWYPNWSPIILLAVQIPTGVGWTWTLDATCIFVSINYMLSLVQLWNL